MPKYEGINPLDKLHPGEPYFFIRAQDVLSVEMIVKYGKLLERESVMAHDMGKKELSLSLHRQATDIANFALRFRDWQEMNRDKIKLPD